MIQFSGDLFGKIFTCHTQTTYHINRNEDGYFGWRV